MTASRRRRIARWLRHQSLPRRTAWHAQSSRSSTRGPASKDPIWDFFGSKCAYCGVKLVKGERLGHIDHATSKAGNHTGNLVLACSVCNGDEKLDMDWREFLEKKVSDPALRQERIARIERWQALHPKPELAASPQVAALNAELRAMIVAFGEKCAELRTAVAHAKSAAADSEG